MRQLSRRAFVSALMLAPATITIAPAPEDANLIRFGRQFEAVDAALGLAADRGADRNEIDLLLEKFDVLEKEILVRRASTTDGFIAKARAAACLRTEPIAPQGEPTSDERLAWSLVKDILAHQPESAILRAIA